MITKTTHKTEHSVPKCVMCGSYATHGTFDCKEIPSPAGEYREFKTATNQKLGCALHPVQSFTTYLDGRVLLSSQCVPEKNTCSQEKM